jgi:ABC-type transport system substrate-binding protein
MICHWAGQLKGTLTTLLLLSLLFVVACGGAAPPPPKAAAPEAPKAPAAAAPAAPAAPKEVAPAAPAATPIPKAAPKPTPVPATTLTEKRLHLAITPLPQDTFLPWLVSTSGLLPMRPMWENLTTIDPRTGVMKPLPQLATEWEMSKDAKSFSFKLRKGVPFHFGKGEFTVQDFITSLDQAIVPEPNLTGCKGAMAASMGAKSATEMREKGNLVVIDDHTFTMNLAKPHLDLASWWFNLQGRPCAMIYSSAQFKAEGQAMFEKGPAGTGPYQFARRQLREFAEYERVPYKHWRVNPEFKTLRISTVPEDATRLAMLLTKEADMVDIPKVLHDQAVNAGMEVLTSDLPSLGLTIIPHGQYYVSKSNYNPDLPWAAPGEKGRLVREALNRAVNRKQIVNVLFKGLGEPMYNTIFHQSLEGWNPEWETKFQEKYGYDPEKAKKLLDQAGYPGVGGKNRFKMEVWMSSLPGLPETIEVAQAVAQEFQNIGIDAKIVEAEFARALDRFRDQHNADFILPLRMTIRPIDANFRIYYFTGPLDEKSGIPNKGGGSIFVEDSLYDQIMEAFTKETDPAGRERLARQAGDHIYNNYRTIPVVYIKTTLLANPKVVAEYHFGGGVSGEFAWLEYARAAK